jgi:hypothetical protein
MSEDQKPNSDSIASRSWNMLAHHTCIVVGEMLIAHFGERCPSSEPDCPICERWHLLDQLVKSPYEDD